ncbi:MAG TPA: site-2 protease family protein [Acidimicrobiales bacterium]|nr:site-2 protease family protein [Acidimicrobiales bacterium]
MNRTRVVLVVIGVVLVLLVLRRGVITQGEIIFFAVLVPSIILHEVTHGAVAYAFGDDTAARAGRLTLNPIRHVDPFGTLILPALLVLSNHAAFGYAKPVPVSVRRLRHPRNEGLIVSLAGPAVNVILALGAVLAIRAFASPATVCAITSSQGPLSLGWQVLATFSFANVLLAVFNILPIPPLDGSAVVERMLPVSWWPRWLQFRQYSMPILLVVVLLWPQILGHVFSPAERLWFDLLPCRVGTPIGI